MIADFIDRLRDVRARTWIIIAICLVVVVGGAAVYLSPASSSHPDKLAQARAHFYAGPKPKGNPRNAKPLVPSTTPAVTTPTTAPASNPTSTAPTSTSPSSVPSSPPPTTPIPPSAVSLAPIPSSPGQIAKGSGSGNTTTAVFAAPGVWYLQWRASCPAANFSITPTGVNGTGVLPAATATQSVSSGVTSYSVSGNFTLVINGPGCTWLYSVSSSQ